MKHKYIIPWIVLCHTCFGQHVEEATSIAPEDLGAYKWVLSGTAQENEVVIFRVSTVKEWFGKIETDVSDSVHYSPGEKQTETAFFIDPRYFDPKRVGETEWKFQTFRSSGWIKGRHVSSSFNVHHAEINFNSEEFGKTKMIFQVFIEPYEKASALYPKGLPSITPNMGWGWNGSPKIQSAPVDAHKPTNAEESKPEVSEKPQPESKVTPR